MLRTSIIKDLIVSLKGIMVSDTNYVNMMISIQIVTPYSNGIW